MDRKRWKTKIKAACRKAGTYRPYFDSAIDTLAGIMEARDSVEQQFIDSGGEAVVERESRSGVTTVKNPALVMLMDCNAQALAYWRDLGLTPAGLRRLNEKAMKEPEKKESFADILAGIGV